MGAFRKNFIDPPVEAPVAAPEKAPVVKDETKNLESQKKKPVDKASRKT